ncbi:LOW QUALITY PROTEIN: mucin-4-like [Polyodon spathula]|uniref:LOW QUALITY PROTEIN: mucin-4-like n=1 Tax=Polyodon spathula TaxID=7913 RepID=UPI001B7DE115|nr:LOW QUALITY PROTEIN: mucin-4-like [Polyodon spathula]
MLGATITIPVPTTTVPLATTVEDLGPAVALYEFGVTAGDLSIKENNPEVTSAFLKPKIGFPFGATMYKSLYFTDTGQIIFPAFDREIRKYTNPPAEGFKTSSKPAMLAAIWDDADLSSGGNIFYQLNQHIASPLTGILNYNYVVKDIELKIQTNLKVTYTAKWTLKITWENIPAYPAEMFKDKRNTFQAIIITDGVEAYAMMLYKDKGMNWDTDRLATRNVLMGYNSADVFFLNDGQRSKTPKDKYRPDRFIGANSNIRGLWIYKLTNGIFKENFKVKCLEWEMQDGRYCTAGTDGDLTVLRSVSSASRQGARCLYNKKANFTMAGLRGTQKKITESSQAEDLEIQPHTWCCKNTEDPKLCDYYQTKRPKRDCSSYRAPSSGLMSGVPHIVSFDGLYYNFILINARDSVSSFTLQARTVITPNPKATNFNDFAAQYKENGTTNAVLWTLKGTDSVDVTVNSKLISEFTTGKIPVCCCKDFIRQLQVDPQMLTLTVKTFAKNQDIALTLLQHMNCASKGIKGYSAVFDPKIGIVCVSPCLTNDYCKHGGKCQHYVEGPMCKCVSFQMYTPYGKNCEYLTMNLQAFFGILFGTVTFIFVVVVLLSLLFYCYCVKCVAHLI